VVCVGKQSRGIRNNSGRYRDVEKKGEKNRERNWGGEKEHWLQTEGEAGKKRKLLANRGLRTKNSGAGEREKRGTKRGVLRGEIRADGTSK